MTSLNRTTLNCDWFNILVYFFFKYLVDYRYPTYVKNGIIYKVELGCGRNSKFQISIASKTGD